MSDNNFQNAAEIQAPTVRFDMNESEEEYPIKELKLLEKESN